MTINIYPHFAKVLKDGIHKAPSDKSFVAVHVSSWHMSIFYEYYDTLQEIEKEKGYELVDPVCYSTIKLVWSLKENLLLFYDDIGMVNEAHDQWNEQKDLPKPEPIPAYVHVPSPLEKKDHYCQFDPGKDTCYFCGEKRPE